jgi:hypothetical protein
VRWRPIPTLDYVQALLGGLLLGAALSAGAMAAAILIPA